MIIADTDVLIDYLQGKGPSAARIALELEHAQLYTTAITHAQLKPLGPSRRRQTIKP